MKITKVLYRKNGVQLLEICSTDSDGQIEKTWVIKSTRLIQPPNFPALGEAQKFFEEEAGRCE